MRKRMKICFMIENAEFGGGERAFLQIIKGLNKEEFEPLLICGGRPPLAEQARDLGVRVIEADFHKLVNPAGLLRITAILRRERPDVVHTQGARVDFYGRFAAAAAHVPATVSTVATSVYTFTVNPVRKTLYAWLNGISERFADHFITVSDSMKTLLAGKHRIAPGRISVIYNGIETDEYVQDGDAAAKFRAEFNCAAGAPLIVTVGRLVREKGLPYFIQAAAEVLASFPGALFLIAGDGEKRRELEALIERLGIGRRVILTGFRDDVKQVLSGADVFALASVSEGLPMIVLEAMAMAKPMVLTQLDGIREMATHDREAWLVPPRDPSALAQGIVHLLRNKKKAEELGRAARTAVERRFDIKNAVAAHETLYRKMIPAGAA